MYLLDTSGKDRRMTAAHGSRLARRHQLSGRWRCHSGRSNPSLLLYMLALHVPIGALGSFLLRYWAMDHIGKDRLRSVLCNHTWVSELEFFLKFSH
ncbi:hypothetical protein LY78DRAFT_478090 [Colletotrichum sublineola]|nr:hypothetical protein LY78DRAFT_478090 [Colletotrichum sublineola]